MRAKTLPLVLIVVDFIQRSLFRQISKAAKTALLNTVALCGLKIDNLADLFRHPIPDLYHGI